MSVLRQPGIYFALCLVTSALPAACLTSASPVAQSNREIGISFAPSLIAYREYNDNGTVHDSEHGWISGGGVKASVPFEMFGWNWLSGASYQYNDGFSKHWSLQGNGPAVDQYKAAFRSKDVALAIGRTFAPTARFLCTPGIDAEYRYWHRGLPEAKLEILEKYTFWAPGVGISASYNPVGRFVVMTRAGVAYTVYPTNAGIGNPAHQVPDVTFSLGSRAVWQADLGADYGISRSFHAFAGIDSSRFRFGASGSEPAGPIYGLQHEPKSLTDLAQINVGFAWAF